MPADEQQPDQEPTREVGENSAAPIRSSRKPEIIALWIAAIAQILTVGVLAVTAVFIYLQASTAIEQSRSSSDQLTRQLEETREQNQRSYLQDRSDAFLNFELSNASLGCIYAWWTPRQLATEESRRIWRDDETPFARANTPAARQCDKLHTEYEEFSRVLLYAEEALMFFVEEARFACDTGVDYGQELEIWRRDVLYDASGIFSFYILNRFGDPDLAYAAPSRSGEARAQHGDDWSKFLVIRYLEQARLVGANLAQMCERAEHFRRNAAFDVEHEVWVVSICTSPDPTPIGVTYSMDQVDDAYCREVHYLAE